MITEPVVLAIIGFVGGAGGLVTLVKAFLDARENKAARLEDADERLAARLERKLTDAEVRIAHLEAQHERDVSYILSLATALAKAGIDVPSRYPTTA